MAFLMFSKPVLWFLKIASCSELEITGLFVTPAGWETQLL